MHGEKEETPILLKAPPNNGFDRNSDRDTETTPYTKKKTAPRNVLLSHGFSIKPTRYKIVYFNHLHQQPLLTGY
jgi:hypothetical protein